MHCYWQSRISTRVVQKADILSSCGNLSCLVFIEPGMWRPLQTARP